jgi:ubiquinone/menaquinone biosynthesis C-methylase UbiE
MSDRQVDYDRIAPTYDQRFAGDGTSGIAAALLALAAEVGAKQVLEVGCGTGRWLAELRSVSSQLYGVDLSVGMLAGARGRHARLHLVRGRASQLPFRIDSFDLVYCVNALHHFQRLRAFVFQARRLLRTGGALALAGMDPHGRFEHYYIYRYFDGVYETDLARFPSWDKVKDWMRAAGFERVESRLAERILDPKVGRAVLGDPFLHKDATSQLALLSDVAYATGLDRIRTAIDAAEAAGESLLFPVDIPISMLVGRVGR